MAQKNERIYIIFEYGYRPCFCYNCLCTKLSRGKNSEIIRIPDPSGAWFVNKDCTGLGLLSLMWAERADIASVNLFLQKYPTISRIVNLHVQQTLLSKKIMTV